MATAPGDLRDVEAKHKRKSMQAAVLSHNITVELLHGGYIHSIWVLAMFSFRLYGTIDSTNMGMFFVGNGNNGVPGESLVPSLAT